MTQSHTFRVRCAFLLGTLLTALSPQAQTTFRNPVIRGDVADPSILRWGDAYYATGTSSEWAPQYPLFRSTDLVNWTQVGHVFNEKPSWTVSSFWAPELFSHDGKVFCYYSARRASDNRSYIGVAVADRPEGPYEDHGPLVTYGSEDIDAFVFDDGGQLYITWKAYGLDQRPVEILCQPLSADGLSLCGEISSIYTDSNYIGSEGQCIFREGDWYYLLYSSRGCCGPGSDYEVRVARSRTVNGIYEPYDDNPILMRSTDFQACGHGTLVTTPDGRRYYLCHSYQRGADFFLGRQPILQELVVGSDEWPHFLTGRLATARQPLPFAGTAQQPVTTFRDDFDGDALNVAWTWNYPFCNVSATLHRGQLLLGGTPCHDVVGAVLALRPSSSRYSYETRLTGSSRALAGLTWYGDDRSHIVFGRGDGRLQLVVVRDGQRTELFSTPCRRDVTLRATVTGGCHLTFAYSLDGHTWLDVPADAVDGLGIMCWDRVSRPGLYSAATPRHPAAFDYFLMEPR